VYFNAHRAIGVEFPLHKARAAIQMYFQSPGSILTIVFLMTDVRLPNSI
jgi:hypothetical protein